MKVQFIVTLNMLPGKLDLEALEANLIQALQKAQDEGAITPNEDEHAMLADIDVLPQGRVE